MPRLPVVLDLERLRDPCTGLGQFCLHLGRAILECCPEYGIEPTLLAGRPTTSDWERARRLEPTWWRRGTVRPWLRWWPRTHEPAAALWHLMHHQSPFRPADPRIPLLITIHDLKFLHLDLPPLRVARKLRHVQRIVDEAAGIAAISHAVRDDIVRHLNLRGKPLRVIPNGVYATGSFAPEAPPDDDGRPFLFSIGYFERKKNFHTLVEMLEHLPDLRLVLAGDHATPYGREVRTLIARRPWGERVRLPGRIDDARRQWYYERCAAFLLPSLAEGFGLPVLEALAAGRTTVLARRTSLPEVGGAAAHYWDDFEPARMATIVKAALFADGADPAFKFRALAQAARFSWTAAGKQYAAWYRELGLPQSMGFRRKCA